MAALTYGFTQLGPYPLDAAFAAPSPAVAPPPSAVTAPPTSPTGAVDDDRWAEAALRDTAPPPRDPSPIVAEPRPDEPEARIASPSDGVQHETLARRPSSPAVELRDDPPSTPLSFPEFTDSAPTRARERAADGPRLDSLFQAAAPPSSAPETPANEAPDRLPRSTAALLSCEAAIARNEERLEIGGPRGPADITRESYASILQNGSYLSACRVPEKTVLEICAAVKQGRAVGVTVTSSPPSADLRACVRGAIARLSFPHSERLDVTHTRFDAVRR
jgi:hypothetical protein